MADSTAAPRGHLTTRTVAMPADANPYGDIFGGWVLSQMDLAGGIVAGQRAEGRVATVAVEAMSFLKPVYIGDVLSVYTELQREGRTSVAVHVEAWALRDRVGTHVRVTEGLFTFVAIDNRRKPRPLPPRRAEIAPDES
jgi:acyl-CoA thioesterase YciA